MVPLQQALAHAKASLVRPKKELERHRSALEKMQAALVRGEAQAAQVDEVRRTAALVLGSWGNTIRDAVRNTEKRKGRCTPTQDPSANHPRSAIQIRSAEHFSVKTEQRKESQNKCGKKSTEKRTGSLEFFSLFFSSKTVFSEVPVRVLFSVLFSW